MKECCRKVAIDICGMANDRRDAFKEEGRVSLARAIALLLDDIQNKYFYKVDIDERE